MEAREILKGKRVLIVDDEPDILETLEEMLDTCLIDTVPNFQTAEKFLKKNRYDIAILDIMGVRGFELLQIAKQRGIPALMLTAHSLNKETLKKSAEEGAAYFVPKAEIAKMDVFVADVIEAREKKRNPWVRWFERLGSFFDTKTNFTGPNWREEDKKFWDEKLKGLSYY